MTNLKPRQRVLTRSATGYTQKATLVRRQKLAPGWWVVRFDADGASLSVHEEQISAL